MGQTRVTRAIASPPTKVFEAVAHIENFSEVVPGIIDIEFLTDAKTGVGTRFRETRVMKGRESTTELEVTEYVPDERVRLVSDEGGTIWDTVFTVTPSAAGSELSMVMVARPHTWKARIITPLIGRMVATAVESDMDAVKAWCESAE
jgi:uncharacterized protein YndB with AHSA1/START domain